MKVFKFSKDAEGVSEAEGAIFFGDSLAGRSGEKKDYEGNLNVLDLMLFKYNECKEGKGKRFVSPTIQSSYQKKGISLEAISENMDELEDDIMEIRPKVVALPVDVIRDNRDRISKLKSNYGFKVVAIDSPVGRKHSGLLNNELQEYTALGVSAWDYKAELKLMEKSHSNVLRDNLVDGVFDGEADPRDSIEQFFKAYKATKQKKEVASISNQLEEMFRGRADGKTLEKLMRDVDTQVHLLTDKTGSIGIIDVSMNGMKAYGKISANIDAIENEYAALLSLQDDELARLLVPKPIGMALTEDLGALFLWGTENKELYDMGLITKYNAKFSTLLTQFAKDNNYDLVDLACDVDMQDIFNTAIINTANPDFVSVHKRPSVMDVDELEQRASEGGEKFRTLREFSSIYRDACRRLAQYNPEPKVFLHGDNRPENIGHDPFGLRPKVDLANAKYGSLVEDIASLEINFDEKHKKWYEFVLQDRAGISLNPEFSDQLSCYNIFQPYRTCSFKLGKARFEEADKDLNRLARNVAEYKSVFKC